MSLNYIYIIFYLFHSNNIRTCRVWFIRRFHTVKNLRMTVEFICVWFFSFVFTFYDDFCIKPNSVESREEINGGADGFFNAIHVNYTVINVRKKFRTILYRRRRKTEKKTYNNILFFFFFYRDNININIFYIRYLFRESALVIYFNWKNSHNPGRFHFVPPTFSR